ncbi:hypothetical protein BC937DRAFT_88447 [Endogone sp. FLAS-F59071]|nr:hypothetical protein BC937DRAFT_88447 [Endogone sp. FLAS-F59071]|eukprot:RUS22571.1 hypothetical protein BC937DRAFT_88447 [Endogone sp. FLAS-F59071]
MKLSLSFLLATVGLASIVGVTDAAAAATAAAAGLWCGKPYAAAGFAAQFRYEPYLSTDTSGSLVVNVPTTGNYTVQVSLSASTVLLPATAVASTGLAQEITGVDLTKVTAQLGVYNVTVTFAVNGVAAQTNTITLYRLPAGPKVVKVDRLYGGIIPANSQTPIFPFGPYIDYGWIVNGSMQTNLQTLKNAGFNIINPDPTYTDLTSVDQLLQICETLGIYVQISFRYDYTNITEVTSRVQRWSSYNALLTWYSTDEPDGTQWISNAPTISVYHAIKATDPYHPVALVLNCQNSAGYYTGASDIYGTDMYPIGISTTGCTATSGDCGCDECTGSLTADIISRTQKYESDYAAQGVQSIPVWMGLQAFSDPGTWWSRAPTPAEFTVMFWLTIIEGYKAITFWKYPYVPDNTLAATHTTLAGQLASVGPSYILSSKQLPSSHVTLQTGAPTTLFASAWLSADKSSLLIITVNGATAATPYTITVADAKQMTSTSGKDVTTGNAVNLNAGVITGNLSALGVGVYTFGLGTPVSSTSVSAAPSTTGSSTNSSSTSATTTTTPESGAERSAAQGVVLGAIAVLTVVLTNL